MKVVLHSTADNANARRVWRVLQLLNDPSEWDTPMEEIKLEWCEEMTADQIFATIEA